MEIMGIGSVAVITVLCYLLGMTVRQTPLDNKWIPSIVGGVGLLLGFVGWRVIPYMGNKFRYKVGYIPNSKVLIGATGFTGLTVLKDGATFGTFDVTGLDEISVGFSEAGSYSAYLTNGSVKTMSCYWTVE